MCGGRVVSAAIENIECGKGAGVSSISEIEDIFCLFRLFHAIYQHAERVLSAILIAKSFGHYIYSTHQINCIVIDLTGYVDVILRGGQRQGQGHILAGMHGTKINYGGLYSHLWSTVAQVSIAGNVLISTK